jgi:LmbE family N-acetylglucosaminyl deacetylase
MMVREYMRAAERLPLKGISGVFPRGGALVLAPHPDDESLGCGGLIATLTARGRPVRIVVMSDGAGSHPNSRRFPADALRAMRRSEAEEAVALLGAGVPHFLNWPDGAVPASGTQFEIAVAQVTALAKGFGTIVATSGLDPHIDHVSTSLIAREAAWRLGIRILVYPVWSWRYLYPEMMPIEPMSVTSPPQGMRLDVSANLDLKRRAVMAHRSQTTRLIDDDPDGFILTPAALSVLLRPYEVFLEDRP